MNGRESGASTERTAEGPEQLMLPPLGLELDRAVSATVAAIQNQEDAPPCSTCGAIMVRSGSCYKCINCGSTSGCS